NHHHFISSKSPLLSELSRSRIDILCWIHVNEFYDHPAVGVICSKTRSDPYLFAVTPCVPSRDSSPSWQPLIGFWLQFPESPVCLYYKFPTTGDKDPAGIITPGDSVQLS